MNASGSDNDQHCSSSSGCESGWTMYLDQSSSSYFSKNQHTRFRDCARVNDLDDGGGEEDLSMVSDASSGPPHYTEDCEHGHCFGQLNNNKISSTKNKTKQDYYFDAQNKCSVLDDTATSPIFTKKVGKKESLKGGFVSAIHCQGTCTRKKQFEFLQSSSPEKSASKQQGGFQGTKWK